MARHVTTHVVVEVLEVDGGLWCQSCLLPSGRVQTVAVRCGAAMHLQQRPWCDECGRRDTVILDKS